MLKFTSPYTGNQMDAMLIRDAYADNGRLFLGLKTYNEEDKFWEPWCDITVNLPFAPLTDETCSYVDTNNAGHLRQWLEDNHLGEWTGKVAHSGYCAYPEFRFNLEEIEKHLASLPW